MKKRPSQYWGGLFDYSCVFLSVIRQTSKMNVIPFEGYGLAQRGATESAGFFA